VTSGARGARRSQRRTGSPRAASAPAGGRRLDPAGFLARHERRWVIALLLLHAGLALWGAARNSVTFDENFHLPSGVVAVTRRQFHVSAVNPPLVKALCALPALALGAVSPDPAVVATGNQALVGESFMRRNAGRYHRVFFGARMVVVALSLALGMLVWRFARRLYGPAAGVLALGFYAVAPEALAHAGLATLDVATGLGLVATVYAFWLFVRTGRWRWWGATALALGAFALTRFTAMLMFPILALLLVLVALRGHLHRPLRLTLGTVLLVPAVVAALNLGYLGRTSFLPLARATFHSERFQSLQRAAPGLQVPFPDEWLRGLDWQARESQGGTTPTYLLGRVHLGPVWYYFPLALLFKWPLGFLGALAARSIKWRLAARRHEDFLLVPGAVFLAGGMFLVQLNAGVRYMFPLLPLGCIWIGALAGARRRDPRPRRPGGRLAAALLALAALEAGACAPWYLAFFNWPSGGPGGGYRLVNDSNVDWGQGLIALRDEMRRRGIGSIHLAYHGTTDPAVYGIAYRPFLGGAPDSRSEWIAISSYYFVGLAQRMMTPQGRTGPLAIDFRALWKVPPVAAPAGCMYLYPAFRPPDSGGGP
jgi:dolichyl-phosphate-mannose-protein mannosyltransferase